MSVRRLAFVLFALCAAPAVATAGPIAFTYTATSAASQSGPYNPGPLTFSLTPAGNVGVPANDCSLELGAVQFDFANGPQGTDTYTAYTNFAVSVVVTDAATGRSDTLTLRGDAADDWTYRSWDGLWRNDSHQLNFDYTPGSNVASKSAVIGNTRYTLSVYTMNDKRAGVFNLSATITTPEPGALALAAIGLAPLGARLLRRRVKIVETSGTPG